MKINNYKKIERKTQNSLKNSSNVKKAYLVDIVSTFILVYVIASAATV